MRVVGYLRLSRDDGNDESISIGTQKKIIRHYASMHGYTISEWYIDDGFSGYTFDRPSFNRLKRDLYDGNIDIIIAKDLSRLGRHNAKTLLFIEEVTKLNKMIILTDDDYNNLEDDDDMIGIKTWFNERHVKDTSKKVRNAIEALQQDGSWTGNVPFGYRKIYGKKHAFEVDPVSAGYVRKIFDMYVNGMGGGIIAKTLNREGIPTPTQYTNILREERGLDPLTKVSALWEAHIIRRLISNDFYIGTLTQRSTKTNGIHGKKVHRDESEHIKFPNHHEAIIDIDTFNLAQQIKEGRSKDSYRGAGRGTTLNLFAGIVKCGDCGKSFTVKGQTNNSKLYVCRTYHTLGREHCNYNKINERDLLNIVKLYLKECRQSLVDNINKLDKIIDNELASVFGDDAGIAYNTLKTRLNDANDELKVLISQKTKETIKTPSMANIIEETYQELINEKMMMIKSLKLQIEEHEDVSESTKDVKKNLVGALAVFDNIIASETMTRKQLSMLVEKIYVYHDKGVEVVMRGNLNTIIEPKVEMPVDKEEIYLRAIIYELIKTPEFFRTVVYRDLKEKGHEFGYWKTFKPMMDRMEDLGIVEPPRYRNDKSRMLVDKEQAYLTLNICTDRSTNPRMFIHSGTIESLISISKWFNELTSIHNDIRSII